MVSRPTSHRRQNNFLKIVDNFFCSLSIFIWFLRFLFSIRIAKKNANRNKPTISSQVAG